MKRLMIKEAGLKKNQQELKLNWKEEKDKEKEKNVLKKKES